MRPIAIFAALVFASPAVAASTDWQDVAPETRIRLISSDRLEAGQILAGIEVDMPPGFKTYWRVPGETGIPTQVEDIGSRGLSDPQLLWPHPTIDEVEGYLDFVYFGPTVLPLRLTSDGGAGELALRVTMGICSDICVPVQATFSLPVDPARPDPGQDLRLRQALADVPVQPPDDAIIGEALYGSQGLSVPLLSTEIDAATVIIAADDPHLLFGAPQKSPDSPAVFFSLLGGDGQSVLGQSIDITFMTPTGPYVVRRVVGSAGST